MNTTDCASRIFGQNHAVSYPTQHALTLVTSILLKGLLNSHFKYLQNSSSGCDCNDKTRKHWDRECFVTTVLFNLVTLCRCSGCWGPLSQQPLYPTISSRPIVMNWELKYVQDFQEEFEKNGLCNPDSIAKFCSSKMDGWKEVQVDIAIIGNSGTGKSSFINTIRG